MKTKLYVGVALLLAGSLFAANLDPKDEIAAAIKKLAGQPNYGWKTTVIVPEGTQFRPGPTEGKTEKDGLTHIATAFGDNRIEVVTKGDKAAVLGQEGIWQSAAELENAEGPARFLAGFARNVRTPAVQSAELASFAKELKKEGDSYSSDLTEDGAKTFLRFRRGGDGPAISNARGSVKFWLKDGELAKYEYKVQGTISFGGNDIDVDRMTTVEIRDIGKTKVDVPEAAKRIVQ
jgi:hypothetical protein